ncbi:hypothetical protein IW262DRAFT_493995 [Armillaria fumosa]|nr:hypothetical protein IW262DRAFT_493995 [Armillaria fumosa]
MIALSGPSRQLFSLILIVCATISAAPIPKGGGSSSGGHSSGGGSGGSSSHASSSGKPTYVQSIGGTNHCYSDGAYKNEISCPKTKLSWGAISGIAQVLYTNPRHLFITVIILIVFVLCCIKKIRSGRKKTPANNSFRLVAPTRTGLVIPSTPTSALFLIAEPIWTPDSKADKATSFGAKSRIHHGCHEPKRTSWITSPPQYHPDVGHEYLKPGFSTTSVADRMPVNVCS